MLKLIDKYLNIITMYKLVQYYLIALIGLATIFALFGLLAFNPLAIVFSALFIITICWLSNEFFARVYKAQTNAESYIITGLILALLISPPVTFLDGTYFELALWASVLAMASKYILAIDKKHLFNPAAIALVLTAYALGNPASWWVGTQIMLPGVVIGGLLVARKILRFELIFAFLGFAIVSVVGAKLSGSLSIISILERLAFDTPVIFVAFVMLTEPLTTPPTRMKRIIYGALTGFLYAPWVHVGSIFSTPELALVAGNIYSYIVSPKGNLLLTLKKRTEVAAGVFHFHFEPDKKLAFTPGQYLEWTLAADKADRRGNRRYFTLASSPTEDHIAIGVKFYPGPSTFKQKLKALEIGEQIIAGQLAGDFTLPKDMSAKFVFIAGGIGVTPFRSIVKNLIDTNTKRPIVVFYAVKVSEDIAYKDIFDEAEEKLNIKTVYAVTEGESMPQGLYGYTGFIDKKIIETEVPDYKERIFYISGPRAMIDAYKKTLRDMGVHGSKIKEDFFPGFV